MPAGKGYGPKARAIAGVGKRGGAARDAGKKVEKRKASNRSSLSIAQKYLRQNGAKKL
jgi:hypothetical protein